MMHTLRLNERAGIGLQVCGLRLRVWAMVCTFSWIKLRGWGLRFESQGLRFTVQAVYAQAR